MADEIAMQKARELADNRAMPPKCSDFDEDCAIIPDKVHCWLYDPAKGSCPYLAAQGIKLEGEGWAR